MLGTRARSKSSGRAAPDRIGKAARAIGLRRWPFEVSYPNGDRAAYVAAVYEAEITSGLPEPADGELTEVAWFHPDQLPDLQLNRFARALLAATGYL